jgi:uroporphyrinogen decarboxylase
MTSRERVLRTITFQYPDRIPTGYFINPPARMKYGEALLELCRQHPNDFYDPGMLTVPERDIAHYRADGSYCKVEVDEWGCEWVYYQEGIMGEVKRAPLDDWAKLKTYRLPEVPARTAVERRAACEAMARVKERFIGWGHAGNLFERMQWLRGVEELFMDIAADEEAVYVLADRIVDEYLLPRIEQCLEDGCDIIGFTDDWGTQTQLLINPRAWRAIFKPRYQKMFDCIHAGGAYAWLHSDGMLLEVVPDLVEIGCDVLNPQLGCLDLQALATMTAGHMAIYGTLDYQRVLPYGSPEEIDAHVREVTAILAQPAGGFMYGAGVQDDAPLENIQAVFEAMDRHRTLWAVI